MPKPSETETIWNHDFFWLPRFQTYICIAKALKTSAWAMLICMNLMPTPFWSASQTAQSPHQHSTISYDNDPCRGWPRLQALQTQRGAKRLQQQARSAQILQSQVQETMQRRFMVFFTWLCKWFAQSDEPTHAAPQLSMVSPYFPCLVIIETMMPMGASPCTFLDYPNNSLCYLQKKLQEVRWTTTRTSPNFGWKIHLTPTKPAKENHDHPQTSWKLWHATPQINPPYAGGGCCWWVLEVFQYNMRSTLHQIIKSLCLIARIKAWPWRKPWTSAISSKQVAELPWAPKCRHNGTVWT